MRKTLPQHSVRSFIAVTASARPLPGGGSSIALAGALAAALTEKVARNTRRKSARTLQRHASALRRRYLDRVEQDARIYGRVIQAWRSRNVQQGRAALRRSIRMLQAMQRDERRLTRLLRRLRTISPAVWNADLICAVRLADASAKGGAALLRANQRALRRWIQR